MKTNLSPKLLESEDRILADSILRTCVHCGFCNATCPTYQLLGDENEGPRGRIYLIKQMLEGHAVGTSTQKHLDHCLTCRNCETTCPSGVKYSQLLDIGRKTVEKTSKRSFKSRLQRKVLRLVLPRRSLFAVLFGMGRAVKPLLPKAIRKKIPKRVTRGQLPIAEHRRKMLILDGCVQPALSPDINAATARVLHKLEITLITPKSATCCGAVSQHLSAEDEAKDYMRRNIDAWWPDIENGAEAIVMTASGCGAMVKEYGHYLRHDPLYAEKAQRVSELCKDISEIIEKEINDYPELTKKVLKPVSKPNNISWHPPCTLQHGQKINGVVERILGKLGYQLLPVRDSHLCCGSAGTYSILEAELSQQLQANKIKNLQENQPEMIVTGNIGCQTHLQEVSEVPVAHWIHLLDQ